MRKTFRASTIESELDLARQEICEIADSMREASENMPEQLNGGYSDAAVKLEIALSRLYECDVPAELSDQEVAWPEWQAKKLFRPQRRDNVVSFLRAYLSNVPQSEENRCLVKALQQAIDILERVYFPGMSGRRAA
jgi:hypothetical protein